MPSSSPWCSSLFCCLSTWRSRSRYESPHATTAIVEREEAKQGRKSSSSKVQQKTPGRRGKITRLEWLLCPPGQRFVHLSIHRANRVPPTPPPARNRCGYEKGVTTSPPQLPKFSRNNSAEYQRQRREVSQRETETETETVGAPPIRWLHPHKERFAWSQQQNSQMLQQRKGLIRNTQKNRKITSRTGALHY